MLRLGLHVLDCQCRMSDPAVRAERADAGDEEVPSVLILAEANNTPSDDRCRPTHDWPQRWRPWAASSSRRSRAIAAESLANGAIASSYSARRFSSVSGASVLRAEKY